MCDLVSKVFSITDVDIANVRATYGKTEDDIQYDVDIIIAWLEKQAHLPKEHDRKRLERFLLRNKFRLERTKQKLDAYFSSRNLYGEFFLDMDFLFKKKNTFYHVILPKLTPSLERVAIMKVGKVIEGYHINNYTAFLMLMMDLQLSYDYSNSERLVFDMEGYTLNHLKTLNINNMSKYVALYLNCFSGRLSGWDIINPISTLSTLMSIFNLCVPAKIMSRIRVHKSFESLYEVIPQTMLPVDYGGNERSLDELNDDAWKMVHEKRDFIVSLASMVSNEQLRINSELSSEHFGADGSFKKINID